MKAGAPGSRNRKWSKGSCSGAQVPCSAGGAVNIHTGPRARKGREAAPSRAETCCTDPLGCRNRQPDRAVEGRIKQRGTGRRDPGSRRGVQHSHLGQQSAAKTGIPEPVHGSQERCWARGEAQHRPEVAGPVGRRSTDLRKQSPRLHRGVPGTAESSPGLNESLSDGDRDPA